MSNFTPGTLSVTEILIFKKTVFTYNYAIAENQMLG